MVDDFDYAPPPRQYTPLDWAAVGFIIGVLLTTLVFLM